MENLLDPNCNLINEKNSELMRVSWFMECREPFDPLISRSPRTWKNEFEIIQSKFKNSEEKLHVLFKLCREPCGTYSKCSGFVTLIGLPFRI